MHAVFKVALFFSFLFQSRLFIGQASSSFKCFDMHTFMYATPTFITEAYPLVTEVQLLLMTVTVN